MAIVEDPVVYLEDHGVTVTSGAISGLGILDMPGDFVLGGEVVVTDYSVIAEASKFGSLKYGAAITVAAIAYIVIDNRLIDDGTYCQISLKKT